MKTKTCSKCKEEKSTNDFYGRRKTNLHSWCKVCNKALTLERQRNFKRMAVEYKGGECQDCGIIDHQAIYDFHHLTPEEKDFNISKFRATSWCDKIEEELDKCVLLCANCHRKRHSNI
jgi:hypothetical protein